MYYSGIISNSDKVLISNIDGIVYVLVNSELGEQMHADIFILNMFYSPPFLASPLLPGMLYFQPGPYVASCCALGHLMFQP